MASTVLQIIQGTADLIGLPRPISAVESTDQQARQLLALLRETLDEMHDREWQRPTREWEFTTVAAELQPDGIDPAVVRTFINGSFFNRTTNQRLIGPLSPQEWQAIKAFPPASGIYLSWRLRENGFLVTPIPPAGQTVTYEFITDVKVRNGSTEKLDVTLDTDVPMLNNTLVALGLRWRFLKAKGFDYAEDLATYERRFALLLAQDGGAPTLNTAAASMRRSGPFVTGISVGLSEGGLLLEDGGNLLLETSGS